MSNSLGNLTIAANVNQVFQAPFMGIKAIVIGNESGLTCTITMENGGVQKTLYPSSVDWFDVRSGFNGNIHINPSALLNNVATFPASALVFDAISIGDREDGSGYPLQLNRNTNVGNQVQTVLGTASAVQNDGSTAGTSIIESTVQGDGSSAVSLTNSAHLTLGSLNNPAIVTILGSLGASQQIQIDALSTLIVPQQIHANLIKTITGNDLALNAFEAGHKIALQIQNSDVIDIDANGITALSGAALNIAGKSITVNGSTSGTATLTQIFIGSNYKLAVLNCSSNYNSTLKTIALPTPFTTRVILRIKGNAGPIRLLSSGSAQTMGLVTGFSGVTGAETTVGVTSITAGSGAQGNVAGFDTIELSATGAVGSYMLILEGI